MLRTLHCGKLQRASQSRSGVRECGLFRQTATRREAAKLGWPDEDLLYQVEAGADDGAELKREIVLCYHHAGLVREWAAARAALRVGGD